jgi:hypothetical protein
VNSEFVQIFKPDQVTDSPDGAPSAWGKQDNRPKQKIGYEGPEFKPLIRPKRPPKEMYFMGEMSFDEDAIFMMPEFDEEFNITEG